MRRPITYPLGGLLVHALWKELGEEKLRTHLFGATASTWADACREAGTTPEALEASFARALAAP